MNNNHEKRIPKFCVDTNEIYYLSELMFNDTPFYVEALNSNTYRYIVEPLKEFPGLKYFEQQKDFYSQAFEEYTRDMRIERITVKKLLDKQMLYPEMFKGIDKNKLPALITNSYLGFFQESKVLNRLSYDRLYGYNRLLKYLQEGKVHLFITDTTIDEVRYAIVKKKIEAIKKFMDLSLVKPIIFKDDKKHRKFLDKVAGLFKKYNRNEVIKNVQENGENDLAIFAESSTLMLDLVSENVEHFITKNKDMVGKEYEISDEFQKANCENGCFYYRNIKGERFIAVAPKILTVIELVRNIRHNERHHENIRGLQETEVSTSGIIW